MATVLSTKILAPNQKQLLLNAGLGFVEYDAIQITPLDYSWNRSEEQVLIFTSKNAAKVVFKNNPNLSQHSICCVGKSTKEYIESRGFEVELMTDYGKDLAEIIATKYSNKNYIYFCGIKRREELPEILNSKNIQFKEVVVYATSLKKKEFGQNFEGVMFFSPSGIESYTEQNSLKNSVAFCIGNTTAKEASKHTGNIVIANSPGIENVIVQVVKYFKQNRLA
jgi:uroporphyrinogen-III synthase